jgi:hypothetical protein
MLAEHNENIVRKEFTVSERVASGEAMAARLGERRGGDHGNQYTGGKAPNSTDCQKEKPVNWLLNTPTWVAIRPMPTPSASLNRGRGDDLDPYGGPNLKTADQLSD